jgi:predicted RNA binding protein YcfA (HicA-like mRNA interferase family)
MPRDAKEVAANLQRKGFTPAEGDHKFYRLIVDGKNTGIRTKISHGEKEISDGLLAQMAKQTKLAKKEFLELVDCPLTYPRYLELLRERGHLPKAEDSARTDNC